MFDGCVCVCVFVKLNLVINIGDLGLLLSGVCVSHLIDFDRRIDNFYKVTRTEVAERTFKKYFHKKIIIF